MEPDDLLPRRQDVALAALAREDLDRLSVEELDARIAALEAEVARTRQKRTSASAFRSAADSLFRKG
jgi:uncharacterized small protein (DUF1192 family)